MLAMRKCLLKYYLFVHRCLEGTSGSDNGESFEEVDDMQPLQHTHHAISLLFLDVLLVKQ